MANTKTPEKELETPKAPSDPNILQKGYDVAGGQKDKDGKPQKLYVAEIEHMKGLVHYKQKDFAAPRPQDPNAPIEPAITQRYDSPTNFVRKFAPRYVSWFGAIPTPQHLIRIVHNLDEEKIRKYFRRKIRSVEERANEIEVERYIETLLKDLKTLKFANIEVPIQNIQYCPGMEDLNEFPKLKM